MLKSKAAIHFFDTLAMGGLVVTLPAQLGLILLVIWVFLVVRWVRRQRRCCGPSSGAVELAIELAAMTTIVVAAGLAPCKTVDKVKARQITLEKPAWTIGELCEPENYGLARPFQFWVSAPKEIYGQVVQFPSRTLTIGKFIAAIESQTPLRHRFHHCGNGSSILWGGDCSFGARFEVPPL